MRNKFLIIPLICFISFSLASCTAAKKMTPSPQNNNTSNTSGDETENDKSTDKNTVELTEKEKAEIKAQEILAEMTMEEKVGQMFFARCPDVNEVQEIKDYKLGGYILFGRDFENKTREQLVSDIKSYQESSDIPLLIGVDEEGGKVVRASKYSQFRETPFLSPQQVFAEGGFDAIKQDTHEKSLFLKDLGINVNLAPVCDVSINSNDFIYSRTFGQNAENTSTYASIVVSEMKEAKIGSVLKHFPGYGNNVDTHTGVSYDKRPIEQFENEDFLPFKAAINVGADSVLVSHNVIESIDPTLPASLSQPVHRILRESLSFNGVIMTDDMAMDGVKNFSDIDTAVLAILAGNDMIITSDHKTQTASVMEAVKKGEISSSRLDESVKKIILWKINIGLIN